MADKLTGPPGAPYSNVNSWLYEQEKVEKKDPGLPMRESNKRTQKESKMPANKMAELFQDLVNTVNELIDDITEIQSLVGDLPTAVQAQIDAHASLMSPSPGGHMQGSSTPPPGDGGGRKGGRAKNIISKGGLQKVKNKLNNSINKFKKLQTGGIIDKQNVQPYNPPPAVKPIIRPDGTIDPSETDINSNNLEMVIPEEPITYTMQRAECVQVSDDWGPIPGSTFWGMEVEWFSDMPNILIEDDVCWNGQPCCNYKPNYQCKCRCKDNKPYNEYIDGPEGWLYSHTHPYCNRYDHFWYAECNYTSPEDCCWWFSIGECDIEQSRTTTQHEHSGNCDSMCDNYCKRLTKNEVDNYPFGKVVFGPPAPWGGAQESGQNNSSKGGGCYVRECTNNDGCQTFSECYGENQLIDNYSTPDGYCWECSNTNNTWCNDNEWRGGGMVQSTSEKLKTGGRTGGKSKSGGLSTQERNRLIDNILNNN